MDGVDSLVSAEHELELQLAYRRAGLEVTQHVIREVSGLAIKMLKEEP